MSEAAPHSAADGTTGQLADVSVPELLARAWATKRDGALRIRQGKRSRSILVQGGSPLSVETSLGEDFFAQMLVDSQKISAVDRSRVEKLAADKDCSQASAVMALGLLDAKALYQVLREQTRNQIGEAFEWRVGEFEWDALPPDFAAKTKPFDTLALLQSELPKRWGTDRLFEALMTHADCAGSVAPRFHLILEKLGAAGPMAKQIVDRLGESLSVGRLLGECAGDPLAAATLWVLVEADLLQEDADGKTQNDGQLEIEVVVDDAAQAEKPAGDAAKQGPMISNKDAKAAGITTDLKSDKKAAALRKEIDALLPQLEDVTHYEALGLEESCSATDIKKAYFRAAKKYHPDALARIGLEDSKEAAAQVFGRISEAFETLTDPDKRKAYDSGDAEPAEIDTARLTQAETSFRKGEILLRMGNFAGALEYLEPAVELWPDEPAYQQALGWALFKQPNSDPDRAQIHLMTALDQNPEDASTLLRLGQIARALGNEGAAADYAQRARSLAPDATV